MMGRLSFVPLVLLLAVSLAACGGGDSPTEVESGVVDISLLDASFSRTVVQIEPGTTVRWTNTTGVHTITPDGHDEWERVSMETQGQTFEHTFDEEGNYDYYCEPHVSNGMTGRIEVVN